MTRKNKTHHLIRIFLGIKLVERDFLKIKSHFQELDDFFKTRIICTIIFSSGGLKSEENKLKSPRGEPS